jgi:hypothetical protein
VRCIRKSTAERALEQDTEKRTEQKRNTRKKRKEKKEGKDASTTTFYFSRHTRLESLKARDTRSKGGRGQRPSERRRTSTSSEKTSWPPDT